MEQTNWHIGSKTKGGASSQSDYIWGRGFFEGRTDVVYIGCGNLPSWCDGDPGVFFAAADVYERKNGAACRHLVVSLPRGLPLDASAQLVGQLIEQDIDPKPFQYAIHHKGEGNQENPHVHIVYSDRIPDEHDRPPERYFKRHNPAAPASGGCRKGSGGKSPHQLKLEVLMRKKRWEDLQRAALTAAS